MATKTTDWDTLVQRHRPTNGGIGLDDRLFDAARALDRTVGLLVRLYGKKGFTAARALEMAREDCDEALKRAT